MLLELEAEEQHPDRERRAEHTEDDAGCHEIDASECVYDEPEATGEDQPGAELAEEEPNEAIARNASLGAGRTEGCQRRQRYVDQRDRHQLDPERLSALPWDQKRGRGSERCCEQPEHDLGPAAEHRILDHHSQMDRHHDEEQSEQGGAAADQRDPEVAPRIRLVAGIHLPKYAGSQRSCPGQLATGAS